MELEISLEYLFLKIILIKTLNFFPEARWCENKREKIQIQITQERNQKAIPVRRANTVRNERSFLRRIVLSESEYPMENAHFSSA